MAETFRWCDRRLAEAAAMRQKGCWEGWSDRHSRRIAREFGGDGIPLGHLEAVFANPWNWEAEQLAEERVRLAATMEQYMANRKLLAIAKWRNEVNERAEAGMREAFRYLRQDDDPDRDICNLGVGQVLRANEEIWAKLWDVRPAATDGEGVLESGRCTVGHEARSQAGGHRVQRIGAEAWREISASFPTHIPCTDGLHVRWFRWLSDATLEHLSTLAATMVASGVWPASEAAVMVVLIPNATGGERPIALYRSAVRMVAKAYAGQAEQWLRNHTPVYLNTTRGRRVGDCMLRQQVTAAMQHDSGGAAVEIAVGIAKAFENVDCRVLVRARCSWHWTRTLWTGAWFSVAVWVRA